MKTDTDIDNEIAQFTAEAAKRKLTIEETTKLAALVRWRGRPQHLRTPGMYVVTEPVDNPIGDARSNGAHWRSDLEKKITIKPGFRFRVREDGTIEDGGARLHWWLFEDSDIHDPPDKRRNAIARDFLRQLMAVSKLSKPTTQERLSQRFGAHTLSPALVFDCAVGLGVDPDELVAAIEEALRDDADEDEDDDA